MRGFETKEHEKEIWASLNRRYMPLKFSYSGDSTYTRDRLARLNTHQEVAGSSDIEIEAVMNYFGKKSPPMQICEVGPGNGMHSSIFLKLFFDSGYKLERYLGLDFSSNLLKIVMQNIKKRFPYLEVNSAIWDIEKEPTMAISDWRTSGSVLMCLTGHTLGCLENPYQVLKNFYLSCIPGDFFLLGVALIYDCDPDTFVQVYRNDAFTSSILEPLRMVGVDLDKGELQLYFSKSTNSIVGDFVIRDEITLEHEGEKLKFERGDSIHCLTSRRFDDLCIKKLLAKSGWKLQTTSYDSAKKHAVYLSVKNS